MVGVTPVFVDYQADCVNLDRGELERQIEDKTCAIMECQLGHLIVLV